MRIAACGLLLFLVAACQPLNADSPGSGSGGGSGPASDITGSHSATMPNLVGKNLQDAQDKVQALLNDPGYLTTSHDASGQKRQQVIDSNWKVCTQNVAAGKQIGMKSQIDFGAVKNDESCP